MKLTELLKENNMYGRKRPYSKLGIRRIPCAHCKQPSTAQWEICANDNKYMGVCQKCDVKINIMVGRFMNLPEALLKAYSKKL